MMWAEHPIDQPVQPEEIAIMSESHENSGLTKGMKTILLGVVGTVTSLTLKEWSDLASALAGIGTFLFMMFKCTDWLIAKIIAKRARKRKTRSKSYED
jgi:hypothetical protein